MDIKEHVWHRIQEKGAQITRPTFNAVFDAAWAISGGRSQLTAAEQRDVADKIIDRTYGSLTRRQYGRPIESVK